jgi:phage tail-like protein
MGKYDGAKGDVVFSGAQRLCLKGSVLYIAGIASNESEKGYIAAIDLQMLEMIWKTDRYSIPLDLTCDTNGNLYLLEEGWGIVKIDRNGNMSDRFELGNISGCISQIEALNEDEIIVYDSIKNTMAIADLKLDTISEIKIYVDRLREVKGLYSGCNTGIYTLEFSVSGRNKKTAYLTRYYLKSGIYHSEVLYSGEITLLCMNRCGSICALNRGNREILFLRPENTMIAKGMGLLPRGIYISHPLDSTVQDMKWHRIEINMDVPEDTQVLVYYMTSNENLNVNMENYLNLPWSSPVINPGDALIEAAAGRYLWIRMDLTGTMNLSPAVNDFTVYFPRTSYLGYLPAVYQEDPESRDFLEGFLSVFETFFMGVEERIDNIAALFDPDSAPPEFLNYIAGWLSLPVSEYWDDERLRELAGRAADIYKMRGTRDGIRAILEIYLKNKVLIVENFQVKNVKKLMNESGKKELEEIFGNDPYSFHVFVNKVEKGENRKFSVRNITKEDISEVKRILDVEKPAYTKACVIILEPYMTLDGHTYMGVNTCFGDPKQRLDRGDKLRENSGFVDIEDMKIDFENSI